MSTDISCPFCGEMIKASAKKCRHCGEFLEAGLTREAVLEKHAADMAEISAAPAETPVSQPAPEASSATVVVQVASAVEALTAETVAAEAPAEPAQAEEIPADVLAALYQHIEQLPDSEEKQKLLEVLKALATTTDGDDESGVEELLKNVAGFAPDVAEIAINTLINPASGMATLVQKVAVRVAESRKA